MTDREGFGRLRAAGVVLVVLCLAAVGNARPAPVWLVPAGTPAGNRVQALGRGTFPAYQALRARTGKPIAWLVAAPMAPGEPARLVGVRADAAIVFFAVEGSSLRQVGEVPEASSADAAPAVSTLTWAGQRGVVATALDGSLTVLRAGREAPMSLGISLSPLTRPVAADVDGDGLDEVLALSRDGHLVLIAGLPDHPRVAARLAVHALPDSRIAIADMDGDGHREAVLLTGPTTRYPHGILGDAVAAESLTIVELRGEALRERTRFVLPPDAVFEDLGVLLADLDGDGRPEIPAVRSSQSQDAGVVALTWRGERLVPSAEGPPIGSPGRWLHLLAVADLEV